MLLTLEIQNKLENLVGKTVKIVMVQSGNFRYGKLENSPSLGLFRVSPYPGFVINISTKRVLEIQDETIFYMEAI
jgi:hypothetical protein